MIACASRLVTDEMFLAAARALAHEVSQAALDEGRLYPRLTRIREVSRAVAVAVEVDEVVAVAVDVDAYVRSLMYEPEYRNYA